MAFVGGFNGTLATFATSVLENIDNDGMSWPQVRAQALADASSFDLKSNLTQAIGDVVGSLSSPETMLRNVLAAQAALEAGHAAGVLFAMKAAPE
jgi:hypothetical protein